MAQKSVDEITNNAIREGGILTLLYFDLHGNSKATVRDIMVGFVGKLSKEKGVIYALGEIDEPMVDGELFSTSAEVKLLVQDFVTLVNLCSRYAPIGIEILRPYELKLPLSQVQAALLNVSSVTSEFTSMYMEKMMTPEEKQEYGRKIRHRMEIGKKLMEKKNEGAK